MWIHLTIIVTFFVVELNSSSLKNTNIAQMVLADKSCKTTIDSLTKKLIYTTADNIPTIEGGELALNKKLERGLNLDTVSLSQQFDRNILVAFIVDTDGSIKGERIINDKTYQVGLQIISIAKTLKWIPASCKGKKVAMLYTLQMNIDTAEE